MQEYFFVDQRNAFESWPLEPTIAVLTTKRGLKHISFFISFKSGRMQYSMYWGWFASFGRSVSSVSSFCSSCNMQ